MKTRFNYGLVLGTIGTMLLGVAATMPANASTFDRLQGNVRHDVDRISRDQRHLQDLRRKRDDQRYRGDWKGVRHTENDIANARLDLQHDRDLLRADQFALDRYSRR